VQHTAPFLTLHIRLWTLPFAPQFGWRESWGEQHTDAILPRLFVLDLGTGSIAPLVASQHLTGWSLGKGCWAPASAVDGENDGEVVFTAWPPGHRLGIIYCTNRPSQIFRTSLEQGSVPVHVAGTETASASSPTIAQTGGDVLLYLVTKVGGPHCQSAQLVARKWQPAHAAAGSSSTDAPVVIIDHGVLYSTDLVGRKVWLQRDLVILQTNLCSRTQLLVADVSIDDATSAPQSAAAASSTKRFRFIAAFDEPTKTLGLGADVGNVGSVSLLAARSGHVVVSFSSPCCPPVLLHGIVGRDGSGSFAPITPVSPLVGLRHKIISLAPHGRGDAILYEPTNDARSDADVPPSARPLIVWPHGGPHSMTTCAYSDFAAAFVRAGFVVVAPNYVGSAGCVTHVIGAPFDLHTCTM
jgi:acylaminoacyl-peptidase